MKKTTPGARKRKSVASDTVPSVKPPDYLPHTDQGNAQRFVSAYGNQLRYDHSGRVDADRSWLAWKTRKDGDKESGLWWEPVADSSVFRAAVKLIERLRKESGNEDYTDWMHATESGYHIREMITRASMMSPIAVELPRWDGDPMLLGVANGVVDLRTGKLAKGKPADYITLHSPVEFDPRAKCPTVDRFLNEIMLDDAEMVRFIIKAAGYSLTGLTRERCLFILHGKGSNGKSKFLELLAYTLGGYAKTTPASTLAPSRANPDAPRNDLARLAGSRFVSANEAELKQGMAEAMVKWLTGGDPIACRFGHGRHFEYLPQFKLWLSCNYRPLVRGTDLAIWDRLPLIPFDARFKGKGSDDAKADDKDLIEKMKAEAPGFLNRLIAGCLEWQQEGLEPWPDKCRAAASEYRMASNPIAPFLESCCTFTLDGPADSKEGDTLNAVHLAYVSYMNRMREKPENIFVFGDQMRAFGFTDGRRNHGSERFWRGVSITKDADFEVEL